MWARIYFSAIILFLVGIFYVSYNGNGCLLKGNYSKRSCSTPLVVGKAVPHEYASAFIPNLGQWKGPFLFRGVMGGIGLFAQERGWTLSLVSGEDLRSNLNEMEERKRGGAGKKDKMVGLGFRFLGASGAEVHGVDMASGTYNFFLGNDPSRWRSGLRGYRGLEWNGLYPGITLRMAAGEGGFEYDLLLEPGADLDKVVVGVEGGEGLYLDKDGSLVVKTSLGPLKQPAPKAWVKEGGRRHFVKVGYQILGKTKFGFEAFGRKLHCPLTLDPKLVFSSFIGGNGVDSIFNVTRAKNGDLVLSGWAASPDFPVTKGCYQSTNHGSFDAIVLRMDGKASMLRFCTFLGGKDADGVAWLSLDSGGGIYLYGGTASTDFPTTKGSFMIWNPVRNGIQWTLFLSKLDRFGGKLLASTYLGGRGDDLAGGFWLAPDGSCWCAGSTDSLDFPLTSGSWKLIPQMVDCFLLHVNGSFSKVLFSGIFGGKRNDYVADLARGPYDYLYLGGRTESLDFPVSTHAYQNRYGGGKWDGFVTKVDIGKKQISESTYLGGNGWDWVTALAGGKTGTVYCGGKTESKDFPSTVNGWCKGTGGPNSVDLFLARFEPGLHKAIFITTIGGTYQGSRCRDLALDSLGFPVMGGKTVTSTFPATPGAFTDRWRWGSPQNSGWDAFLLRFDPMGRKLLYSSFLGGEGWDWGFGLCAWGEGMAILVGNSSSKDFPVTNGVFQNKNHGPVTKGTNIGMGDGFVTCMRLGVPDVKQVGWGTPHGEGYPALYTTADPVGGSQNFGFESWKAPGKTAGILLVGFRKIPGGWNWQGAKIYVDPRPAMMIFGLYSGGWPLYKSNRIKIPIPTWAKGLKLVAQALWVNSGSPFGPMGTFSTSDALEVTVK